MLKNGYYQFTNCRSSITSWRSLSKFFAKLRSYLKRYRQILQRSRYLVQEDNSGSPESKINVSILSQMRNLTKFTGLRTDRFQTKSWLRTRYYLVIIQLVCYELVTMRVGDMITTNTIWHSIYYLACWPYYQYHQVVNQLPQKSSLCSVKKQ